MTKDKRVRIVDRYTGEVRYSDPMKRHLPSRSEVESAVSQGAVEQPQPRAAQLTDEQQPAPKLQQMPDQPPATESAPAVAAPETGPAEPGNSGSEAKAPAKSKPEIETVEQFIAHAYAMKGRKVTLRAKVERACAEEPSLTGESLARLARLAQEDRLFAVPRQIFLASREVQGYPALRATLRTFVRDVMLSHAQFGRPELVAAIRNLPEAPVPARALAMVVEAMQPSPSSEAEGDGHGLKPSEFDELRTNSTYCLAVWLADAKGLTLTELTEALNFALWGPRALRVEHENTKLRELTEIGHLAGVGLASQQYRQQVSEKAVLADKFAREATTARERAAVLEAELERATDELAQVRLELARVRSEDLAALNALRETSGHELAHLRDDFEQLRTRMLRRLVGDVEQLEVGLSALRGTEPRVHVIQDRVERVVDALRLEVNKLKGG